MFDKDRIINVIKTNRNPSFHTLVKKMNISYQNNKSFSVFLNQMKKDGLIAFSKKQNFFYIPEFVGNFSSEISIRNNNDFGFVTFEQDNETKRAIIFSDYLKHSINGDLVNFNVYKDFDYDLQYFAIVKKIEKRKNKYLYGTINNDLVFEPINFSNKFIFKFDNKEVKKNTYVKFEIKTVIKNDIYLELVKTISEIDIPYADVDLIIESANVDQVFNEKVIEEAKLIPEVVDDIKKDNRTDLTNELIVTIDGEKTKDFDDAISVQKTQNKTYVLGVHIADVAYYVKEGSEIDKQALSRATSIYLINKVIPMLPEKLSNGICSLNPNVNRYTLTLEAEIDEKGNVLKSKIFPSCINSKYRLTYNQVENYKTDLTIQKDNKLVKMIENAYELSNILSKVKENQGYIDFEIEEPLIELDENGKTKSIKSKQRLNSEILIENFMVLANEQVSKTISDLKIPSIYRVHEAPNEEKFMSLEEVIKTLKLKDIKITHSDNPKVFANTVREIKKQRFDNFIKITLLRTMQKAKYSSNNIGHFGLASEFYSHFTSPIRRYPDLALHRIIWEIIINKNQNYLKDLEGKIDLIAKISSQKEEEAVSVERKVNDVKKSEFYQSKMNVTLEGIIVSVQKFGIFVEFEDKTDVFVHSSNLIGENCSLNDKGTQIVCQNINYELGQKIKVKIISINKLEGKIDAKVVF